MQTYHDHQRCPAKISCVLFDDNLPRYEKPEPSYRISHLVPTNRSPKETQATVLFAKYNPDRASRRSAKGKSNGGILCIFRPRPLVSFADIFDSGGWTLVGGKNRGDLHNADALKRKGAVWKEAENEYKWKREEQNEEVCGVFWLVVVGQKPNLWHQIILWMRSY